MNQQWALSRIDYWWRQMHIANNIQMVENPPRVRFSNRLVATGGLANRLLPLITLSNHFISTEQEAYDHTIGHEVAHIFARVVMGASINEAHGPIWQRVMRSVGLKPNRCHTYQSAIRRKQDRYTYTCQCGQVHKLSKNRIGRIANGTANYICLKCRRPIVWDRQAAIQSLLEFPQ